MSISTSQLAEIDPNDLDYAYHRRRDELGLPCLRTVWKYCPQVPHYRQVDFLNLTCREALVGGEAGGGKSSVLGMSALQYVDVPGYAALLLRVNVSDFFTPNGLGTRMLGWLQGHSNVRWHDDQKMLRWDHGAWIKFGHIKTMPDLQRYLSQEYSFCGWEELTTFNLPNDPDMINPYLFMNRSLRQPSGYPVPPRIRAATNPGSKGHLFVKKRFTTDAMMKEIRETRTKRIFWPAEDRAYVHSYGEDNEYVDQVAYRKGLDHLDATSRARQKFGDWTIQDHSEIYAGWFRYYRSDGKQIQLLAKDRQIVLATFDISACMRFMTLDAAGTSADRAKQAKGTKSSYSAIGIWLQTPAHIGNYLICLKIIRKKLSIPELRDALVEANAEWRPMKILAENEKFGKSVVQLLENKIPIRTVSHQGKDKKTRAVPLITALEDGKVYFPDVEENWFQPYLEELTTWTGLDSDVADQVDTSAYAALEVFVAKPSKWDARYFGGQVRYRNPPEGINRLGIGVVPPGESGVSAVICVARAKGTLWIDGFIGRVSIETALDNVLPVYKQAFPDVAPHCVVVDHESHQVVRSSKKKLLDGGLLCRVTTRQPPEDEQTIVDYLDKGILEGIFQFSRSDGGNAIVSRLSSYPESVDDAALRGIWLAVHALSHEEI